MKTHALIAAAALSALAAPAMADNKVDNCTGVASMAKSAMELRQTGADPTWLGRCSDIPGDDT